MTGQIHCQLERKRWQSWSKTTRQKSDPIAMEKLLISQLRWNAQCGKINPHIEGGRHELRWEK